MAVETREVVVHDDDGVLAARGQAEDDEELGSVAVPDDHGAIESTDLTRYPVGLVESLMSLDGRARERGSWFNYVGQAFP